MKGAQEALHSKLERAEERAKHEQRSAYDAAQRAKVATEAKSMLTKTLSQTENRLQKAQAVVRTMEADDMLKNSQLDGLRTQLETSRQRLRDLNSTVIDLKQGAALAYL